MLVHQIINHATADQIAFLDINNITYNDLQYNVSQYRNFFINKVYALAKISVYFRKTQLNLFIVI